jgi:hypothetical protein
MKKMTHLSRIARLGQIRKPILPKGTHFPYVRVFGWGIRTVLISHCLWCKQSLKLFFLFTWWRLSDQSSSAAWLTAVRPFFMPSCRVVASEPNHYQAGQRADREPYCCIWVPKSGSAVNNIPAVPEGLEGGGNNCYFSPNIFRGNWESCHQTTTPSTDSTAVIKIAKTVLKTLGCSGRLQSSCRHLEEETSNQLSMGKRLFPWKELPQLSRPPLQS